jgi:hypothetical protein
LSLKKIVENHQNMTLDQMLVCDMKQIHQLLSFDFVYALGNNKFI